MLETMPAGRFLIGYSGGLHHVQAPGEGLPRLFKTVTLKVEVLDIETYRAEHQKAAIGFRASVIQDLERRKARCVPAAAGAYCFGQVIPWPELPSIGGAVAGRRVDVGVERRSEAGVGAAHHEGERLVRFLAGRAALFAGDHLAMGPGSHLEVRVAADQELDAAETAAVGESLAFADLLDAITFVVRFRRGRPPAGAAQGRRRSGSGGRDRRSTPW